MRRHREEGHGERGPEGRRDGQRCKAGCGSSAGGDGSSSRRGCKPCPACPACPSREPAHLADPQVCDLQQPAVPDQHVLGLRVWCRGGPFAAQVCVQRCQAVWPGLEQPSAMRQQAQGHTAALSDPSSPAPSCPGAARGCGAGTAGRPPAAGSSATPPSRAAPPAGGPACCGAVGGKHGGELAF